MQQGPDTSILISLVNTKMPYGKYKDVVLYKIPMHYLEWMKRNGFPKNKLGQQLETLFEIKLNGLEYLLKPLIDGPKTGNR